MPEKLTNKCPKISNEYMFKGTNRHEVHLRNQRRDVSKVREFTKIYTSDDDQVNLVTTAPRC